MRIEPGTARFYRYFLIPMLVLCAPLVSAARDPFVVQHASFSFNQTLLQLDLVVDSDIPDYIAIAIDQGFAVPFMFEFEIRVEKAYWFDEKIISLKQKYLLHYLPMLGSFAVFDVNSSVRHYFDNRKAAVRFLEVVYNYPMLDINNLAPDKEYYARVRFGIDTDELPVPLKSSSLWDNDWDLQSDWYKWEFHRPEK